MVLTITASVVTGTDCKCQYNLYKNRFYSNQECFNSYYKLKENLLGRGGYNDTTIGKLINTFCGGNCGPNLGHLLGYEHQVYFYDRRVSISMYTLFCDFYRISSINTASLISTPVRYYSNASNIEMVVIFISSTPSNSTACHFATLDIIAKYCVAMAVSSILFELCIMSSCKER